MEINFYLASMKMIFITASMIAAVAFYSCDNRGRKAEEQNQQETSEPGKEQTVLNELGDAEKSEGWELLFNGTDTEGWHIYNQDPGTPTGWKVEEGILTNPNEDNDIVTDKSYKDFELVLEWRVQPESNSGVFFHVVETDEAEYLYETGPEYQLLDDKGLEGKLKDAQYSGANYDMQAPGEAPVKNAGEWNQTRIRVKGPHVEHWLNGAKVVEYELWTDAWKKQVQNSKWKDYPLYGKAKEGLIGLQDHGGITSFRNIKIREL